MKRLILTVGAIIACASFLLAQEKSDVLAGWTKIDVCHITFDAPPDLKKTDVSGIDSCVAQFANNGITLYLDYGVCGGLATARGSDLEWKRETLSIGGRDAQLTTFVDTTHTNSGLQIHRISVCRRQTGRTWSRTRMAANGLDDVGNLG